MKIKDKEKNQFNFGINFDFFHELNESASNFLKGKKKLIPDLWMELFFCIFIISQNVKSRKLCGQHWYL